MRMPTKCNLTHKCVHLKIRGWSLSSGTISIICVIFNGSFISLVPGFPDRYPYKVKKQLVLARTVLASDKRTANVTQSFPRLKNEAAITCVVYSVFEVRTV